MGWGWAWAHELLLKARRATVRLALATMDMVTGVRERGGDNCPQAALIIPTEHGHRVPGKKAKKVRMSCIRLLRASCTGNAITRPAAATRGRGRRGRPPCLQLLLN